MSIISDTWLFDGLTGLCCLAVQQGPEGQFQNFISGSSVPFLCA